MNSDALSEENIETDARLLLLSPDDNVLVLRGMIESGEKIFIGGTAVIVKEQISIGHKLAAKNISIGGKVLKYGAPIGSATCDINLGDHVHVSNLKSDYTPSYTLDEEVVVAESETNQKEKLL
jgi:hypothetical protein